MKLTKGQTCPICQTGTIKFTGVGADVVASCECGATWTMDGKDGVN